MHAYPGTDVTTVVRELEDRERRFRAVFECALDAIVIFDDHGRVLEANTAAAALFGVPGDTLTGRTLDEFSTSPTESRTRWTEFRTAGRLFAESDIVRIDGERRRVEVSATADFVPGQHLSLMRDVTDRQSVDSTQPRAADARPNSPLECEFRRIQRLEAVGRLAGGLARDFNAQLAVITGHTDWLEEVVTPHADARNALDQIKRATGRAVKLTHGLLAFSRQEVFNPRILDINNRVRRIVSALQDVVGPQVQISLSLNATAAHVNTDGLQLEHILLQLATNARDAMPDGGTIVLATSNEDTDIELSVTDTGVGMDPLTLDRIFEPFFTTKPPGSGLGLGLSTVYGVVTQSGGRVSAESEPGCGTTIRILLPLADMDPADDAEREIPAGSVEPTVGTETILLMEEDAGVALLVESFLTRLGYRVLRAANATEGLRTAAYGRHFDLLICGLRSANGSGRRLLEELRASRPALPAILVSDCENLRNVPASPNPYTAWLARPLTMADLAGLMRRLLDRESEAALVG